MEHSFFIEKIPDDYKSGYIKQRDCLKEINQYLESNKPQSKICAILGLRRTGKTVLLKQSIEKLSNEQKKKTLFIECIDGKTDFYELLGYIKAKIEEGYRYFFIDEITYSKGFENAPTVLSDIYVGINDVKIVVTGTDSLGLSIPSKDIMYERMEMIHTTYTPFGEYFQLTGISTIDDFIKKGSTLNPNIFENKETTDEYVETAIIQNIIKSLKKSEDIERYPAALTLKYDETVLRNEIQRIINRYSQVRTLKAITKQFHSNPLGDARDLILKHEENGFDIISKLKYEEVNQKIAELLGCNYPSGIEKNDIPLIYKYLQNIDVFSNIPVQENDPIEMPTHPGLFHANLKYTLEELQKDNSWIEADQKIKNLVITKAYESAMGKIMENIIIADVYYLLCKGKKIQKEDLFGESSGRWYVTKYQTEIDNRKCEVDLLIFDKELQETYLFEIKHSKENVPNQSIHLENECFIQKIENEFGPVKSKIVLYNGITDVKKTSVPRVSARDFLVEMYNEFINNSINKDISIKNILEKLGIYYEDQNKNLNKNIDTIENIKE